jgi:hypothetical protein
MEIAVKNYGLQQYYVIYKNTLNDLNLLLYIKGLNKREPIEFKYYEDGKEEDLIEHVLVETGKLIEEKEKLDGPLKLTTKEDCIIVINDKKFPLPQEQLEAEDLYDALAKTKTFFDSVEYVYGSYKLLNAKGVAVDNKWDMIINAFNFT